MRAWCAILIVAAASLVRSETAYDPCCSQPCENQGVCVPHTDKIYSCDCENTGYYGKNCEHAYWSTWFADLFQPSTEFTHSLVSGYGPLWKVINRFYTIRSFLMRSVLKVRMGIVPTPPRLVANSGYPHIDGLRNYSIYARTLPPVPKNCPTPMGVVGPKVLPPPEEVANRVLKRIKFKPSTSRTNFLFGAYAQHFTHTFFKTDYHRGAAYTWGDQNVLMSNVYGKDDSVEAKLRTFKGGRVKMQVIDGEEYPEYDPDAYMMGPRNKAAPKDVPPFRLGHPAFNLMPSLLFFTTIFLREHNRVVAILSREHPYWDDERLFQTAKLINLGQTLKITVEDYVQHSSNYYFKLMYDPTILYNEPVQRMNRIHFEFDVLYHWHALAPDAMKIASKLQPISEWVNNPWILTKHGSKTFLKSLLETPAGEITAQNIGNDTLHVSVSVLKQGRELRLQSFNQYRKRFRLKPYTSFDDMTGGDKEMSKILKELYVDIDAVELYPGLMAEKRRSHSMLSESLIEIGSPYSLQGVYGNPIASPQLWRPSTFGGEVGFNIVKSASLRRLICANIPPPCPHVSFKLFGENDEPVTDATESLRKEGEL